MQKEIRYIQEIRAIENSRKIEGKAICFNSESKDLGGFVEVVLPESITPEFIAEQDIVFLYNHNQDLGVLARYKRGVGTLSVEIRDDGVYFSFEAPNNTIGNDVLESVKRGDLDACSFAFTVRKDGQSLEKRSDGMYLRTIKRFNSLNDLSIVVVPAYNETEAFASSRKLIQDEIVELEKANKEQIELKEEAERKAKELIEYYNQLEATIKSIKK